MDVCLSSKSSKTKKPPSQVPLYHAALVEDWSGVCCQSRSPLLALVGDMRAGPWHGRAAAAACAGPDHTSPSCWGWQHLTVENAGSPPG